MSQNNKKRPLSKNKENRKPQESAGQNRRRKPQNAAGRSVQSGRSGGGKKRRTRRKNSAGKGVLTALILILVLAALGISGYFLYENVFKTSTEDLVQKGVQMLQAESYGSAIENFEAAIANEERLEEKGKEPSLTESGTPYVTEAYRGLGMVYYAQQDYTKTRENLQKVIDLGGEATPVLYNLMGLSAMYQEDYDSALSAFDAGVALPVESSYMNTANETESVDYASVIQEMQFNRIVCFEKKLDWGNAKTAMETYIATYPDDTSAQKEAEFLATR